MEYRNIATTSSTAWYRYKNVEVPGTMAIRNTPEDVSDIKDISSTNILNLWETYCESDSIPPEFICAIDKTLLVAPVIDYAGFTYNLPALNAMITTQLSSPRDTPTIVRSAFSRSPILEIQPEDTHTVIFQNWYLLEQLVEWVTTRLSAHIDNKNPVETIFQFHLAIVTEWGLGPSTAPSTSTQKTDTTAPIHPYFTEDYYVTLYNRLFEKCSLIHDDALTRQISSYKNDIRRWMAEYIPEDLRSPAGIPPEMLPPKELLS